MVLFYSDALRDLVPFAQFKKNTHGEVLILVNFVKSVTSP